jgi:hypothetical protein
MACHVQLFYPAGRVKISQLFLQVGLHDRRKWIVRSEEWDEVKWAAGSREEGWIWIR